MIEEVKELLLSTILKDNTKGRNRKIIFWYDEKEEYKELINDIAISDTEIIVYDSNSFWIRYHLEIEEPNKNFILYFPFERIKGSDNPLLDLECLNSDYIFNPDSTTMRIKNLDLDEDCRKIIQKYARFFNSKKREDSFREFDVEKTEFNIDLIITSILLNIKSITEDDILKNIMLAYYNDSKKIEDLAKFGDENFIFELFKKNLGCDIKESSELDDYFKSLVFTYFAYDLKDITKISRYSKYLLKNKSTNVYVFVNSLMRDESTKDCFNSLASNIENEFGISALFDLTDIEILKHSDAFSVIDTKILEYISEQLLSGVDEFDRYLELISIRENKYYYKNFENSYKMIKNTILFIQELNNVVQNIKVDDIEVFIEKYSKEFYKIDTYYRKIYYHFDNVGDKDDLISLKDKVENMYINTFISDLSINWSEMLENMSSYSSNRLISQRTFYNKYITPFNDKKDRIFVIISDALRYECALELSEKIKTFSTKSDIEYMLGNIPSYTKLGMACLLPNKKLELKQDSEDVLVDGANSSSIKDRDSILKNTLEDSLAIKYDDLYAVTKKEWRKMFSGKKIVYIYHDTIDNAGEHNENKIFDACEIAINELEKLVKDLHLTFAGINSFITSDHGFFYKRGKIEEYQKTSKDKTSILQKTRYSYSKEKNIDEGILSINLDYIFGENSGYVNVPKGSAIFARQGSGFNYIHGGAMPQEIIVPVIDIKTSRSAEESKKVTITYSGLSTKITNAITYLEFLQNTNVDENHKPCRYLLHFENEDSNRISDECTIIAGFENTEVKNRFFKEKFVFKNLEYNKDNKYYLVITDEETGIETERIKFVIDITIINNFEF